MRGAVAAQFEGMFEPYFHAAYHHMWEEPKKMDDPQVAREAFISSNIDFDRLFARAQQRDVKDRLLELTQQAVDRGAFGSPTFFVGRDMFFGKNQLQDVEGHPRSQRARAERTQEIARLRTRSTGAAWEDALTQADGPSCGPSQMASHRVHGVSGVTDLFEVPAIYQCLIEFKAVNGAGRFERGRLCGMLVAGAAAASAGKILKLPTPALGCRRRRPWRPCRSDRLDAREFSCAPN
jgi:hypothetical protein